MQDIAQMLLDIKCELWNTHKQYIKSIKKNNMFCKNNLKIP